MLQANQEGGITQLVLVESNKGATPEQKNAIKVFNSEVR